jgi:hypothetical protein
LVCVASPLSMQSALSRKIKDLLLGNQDNVSKWDDMSFD